MKYENATVKDVYLNIHVLTDIFKLIYKNANKRVIEDKYDVVFINYRIVYFEMHGKFNIWNETRPDDKVYINVMYKGKLYLMEINTLKSYQCDELTLSVCLCRKTPLIKVVLDVTFQDEIHKLVNFVLEKN